MTEKSLEKRRDQLLRKMRALKSDAAAARTRFLLFLVEVGQDPKRAWAAGDDSISYEDFLVEYDICGRVAYQHFAEGLQKLERTSLGSAMPQKKLVLRIGHDAVSRLRKIKTTKTTDRFVREANDLHDKHGFPPSGQRLDAVLRELQPRIPKPKNTDDDPKKLLAELEFLRAENARLKPLEEEVQRLRPLRDENDRLVREIGLLKEQLGARKPRKAAA